MNDALLGALLVVAVAIVFWCLSVVCEERFVPALAVICDVLKIPDDVAGATLMAAGACSPEVVSSFIALFVTHSALGVGSVVGSEIFNHLCICAGSVFYAKGGVLVLDKAIVARETLFYAIALVLLLYVLMREHDGDNHIVIRWWAGPVLVAVYALYVVVAASYDSILAKLGAAPAPRADLPPPEGADDRPLALGRRSSLIYEDEPAANFLTPAPSEEIDGSYGAVSNPLHEAACCEGVDESFGSTESLSPSLRRRKTSILRAFNEESRHLINRFGLLRFARDEAHFGDVEEEDGVFGCYLFKANKFYLSCRASTHAWELRWLRVSPGEVCLYRKRDDVDAKPFWTPSGPSRYALRGVTVADAPRHVLALDLAPIYTTAAGREPDALGSFDDESLSEPVAMRAFMLAPNGAVFDAALERLTAAADAACQVVPLRRRASVFIDGHAPTDEMEPSLIEWPEDATCLGVALHVALLPIKWLLHATITDVRTDPGLAKDQAPAACLECVAWLVVLSLAMVWCCETLGALLGLPDSVVGLTLSAIGTSLPNLFASISVARRGLANMAVSNALGSNSFNIYIGLGLPWLIYTAVIGPYNSLPADDIVGPVLVLVVTLLGFLVLLACTGFTLRRGHGVVFLALYLAFLVWAVAKEYPQLLSI